MNETMKVLTTRRSIRKFKADEVPQELLDQIVEAGMYAPTGKGSQSPIIIAVTNKPKTQKSAVGKKVLTRFTVRP